MFYSVKVKEVVESTYFVESDIESLEEFTKAVNEDSNLITEVDPCYQNVKSFEIVTIKEPGEPNYG